MSADDHPKVHLKAAANELFGVYQDWVHQNNGTHLDGGITEGGKWQYRRRKLFCFQNQRYDVPSSYVGKNKSQPSQWSLTAYELRNGTPSRCYFFIRLSCNTSDSSLAPKIFARKLRPDSPPLIVDSMTNLYSTPTPRLQRIWGGLAGHKIRSNIIVNFRTLFYAENCMRQSDFFADCRQGGGDSTQKTDIGKNRCYG